MITERLVVVYHTVKRIAVIFLTLTLVLTMSVPVFAAPTADPGYTEVTLEEFREQYPNYTGIDDPRDAPAARAVQDPGYVVNHPEYQAPFTWVQEGTKWYLYATNGTIKVSQGGWYQENGTWYFLYPVGVIKYDGTTSTGEMAVGWEKIGSYWYYFSGSGAMQTDWYQIGSRWYYFRTETEGTAYKGSMLIGAYFLNSTKGSTVKNRNYYFDANGAMQDWVYPVAPRASGEYFVSLSSCFNDPRLDGNHQGIDINGCDGYDVLSATSGVVESAGVQESMGVYVKLTSNVTGHTGNQLIMRYMHMQSNSLCVTSGQSISANTKLGLVGNTGESSGAHLHFDINYKGKYLGITVADCLNPAAFFPNLTLLQGPTAEVPPYGEDYNYAD